MTGKQKEAYLRGLTKMTVELSNMQRAQNAIIPQMQALAAELNNRERANMLSVHRQAKEGSTSCFALGHSLQRLGAIAFELHRIMQAAEMEAKDG